MRAGASPGAGTWALETMTVPPKPVGLRRLKKPRNEATNAPSVSVSPANALTRMKERREILRASTWRARSIWPGRADARASVSGFGLTATTFLLSSTRGRKDRGQEQAGNTRLAARPPMRVLHFYRDPVADKCR